MMGAVFIRWPLDEGRDRAKGMGIGAGVLPFKRMGANRWTIRNQKV